MLVDPSNQTAGATVTGAIRQAAQATGTSFQYLLATAQVELGLNPQAGAATSSARGLFQFIDQTWLATMKQSGAALGYGQYAAAITKTASGHYEVTDPVMRSAILKLRNDPDRECDHGGRIHSIERRGAFGATRPLAQRRRALHRPFPGRRRRCAADLVGRRQSQRQCRELFSGRRARQYLDLLRSRDRRAANSRRRAQRSHRALRRGGAVAAEYAGQCGRQADIQANIPPADIPPAARPSASANSAASESLPTHFVRTIPIYPGVAASASPSSTSSVPTPVAAAVPDTAGITNAYADANRAPVRQDSEIFHGLFQDPGRTGPVAAVVSQLWGVSNTPAGPDGTPAPSAATLLDLFKDNQRG